jgi:hypothetical protein
MLYRQGFPNLSCWMRYIRLAGNPYPFQHVEHQIWNEQIEYNVPLMIWSCIYIHQMCQENGLKRILFATRDCCHMKRFFDKMYPDHGYEAITFHCSRKMYENCNEQYIEYVRQSILDNQTLFVDLNGTGRSLYAFLNKHLPEKKVQMFFTVWQKGVNALSKIKVTPDGYLYLKKTTPFGLISAVCIEKWNYDLVGTLEKWENGPIRGEPEYQPEIDLVSIYHEAATIAINNLNIETIETTLPSEKQIKTILDRGALFAKLPKMIKYDDTFMDMLGRAKKISNKNYFHSSTSSNE